MVCHLHVVPLSDEGEPDGVLAARHSCHGFQSTFKHYEDVTVVKLQGVGEGVTKVSQASTILLLKSIYHIENVMLT